MGVTMMMMGGLSQRWGRPVGFRPVIQIDSLN